MSWTVSDIRQPDPALAEWLGNKYLIGNGFLGYRGTLDEYTREHKTATILTGLYDQAGAQWREPVNFPNGGYAQVFYRGEALHAIRSQVLEHVQRLNLAQGVHERRTVFEAQDGCRITIGSRRFASLARLPLLCVEYQVQSDKDCLLTLREGIDGEVWDLNGPHLHQLSASHQNDVLTLTGATREKGVPLAVSEWAAVQDGRVSFQVSKTGMFRQIRIKLLAGRPFVLKKIVAHCSGMDSRKPEEESRRICLEAAGEGFDRLLEEHRRRWSARWQACDIQIEGDEEAQLALRFSLYHLLSAAPTHTEKISIPARGLSGQVYKGGIFWDTEIFMLPFFTHAFPAVARNLLMYRYHTLNAARRKAEEYGYRGAYFAWESQDTGEDACTLFNVTDVITGRPIRTFFRDKQIHISADIVYAFWQYFQVTADDTIWQEGGAEVVFECARFFLSYVFLRPEKQRGEILDVTGPDEYHERVHNNFYTNRIVAHTFDTCLKVAAHLRVHHPQKYDQLVNTLDFESDLKRMKKTCPDLYLPMPDSRSLIPQFDGYFSLKDIPLGDLLLQKLHPNEYLGGGSGLATTTQVIKQADVILALFLFRDQYSREIKCANWEYYEPRTEHGSSLSSCSYSLIASQIGKAQQAYQYFMRTATIDLYGEGKQFVGDLYIGGTHPAGNGGAWMAVVQGFCGIRVSGNLLGIEPHLPPHWKQVTLPITFHDQKLHLTITPHDIRVQTDRPLREKISVLVAGKRYRLSRKNELSISRISE